MFIEGKLKIIVHKLTISVFLRKRNVSTHSDAVPTRSLPATERYCFNMFAVCFWFE